MNAAPDHPDETSGDDGGNAGSDSAADRGADVAVGGQDDATNDGQSTTAPAEGADDTAPPTSGSPEPEGPASMNPSTFSIGLVP